MKNKLNSNRKVSSLIESSVPSLLCSLGPVHCFSCGSSWALWHYYTSSGKWEISKTNNRKYYIILTLYLLLSKGWNTSNTTRLHIRLYCNRAKPDCDSNLLFLVVNKVLWAGIWYFLAKLTAHCIQLASSSWLQLAQSSVETGSKNPV